MSKGLMSHNRNLDYLHRHKIIYRTEPSLDNVTKIYDWGYYFEHGTHDCYQLFRSKAKINTYKSLKWHLLVLWYLNPGLSPDEFEGLAKYITYKANGFVTFTVTDKLLAGVIYEVYMSDLERPPKNRARKIIFKVTCGLSVDEKLKIVGQLSGKTKKVKEDDIYECMLDIHDCGRRITINELASLLDCSTRTIHRNMHYELKKEKKLLNFEL